MLLKRHLWTIGIIIVFFVGILTAYDLGKRNAPREIVIMQARSTPVAEGRQTLKVATSQAELGDANLYVDGIDCVAMRSGTYCQGAIRNLTGHEYHGLKLVAKFTSPKGRTAHFVYDLDVLAPQQTFEFNKNLNNEEVNELGLQFADVGYKKPAVPSSLDESEFKDGNMKLTASALPQKQ